MIAREVLNGKKILVTGAGGFIGSCLTEKLLKSKADLTVLVRYTSHSGRGWLDSLSERLTAGLRVVFGDIRDADLCRLAVDGNHYIFHLAAQIAIPYSYIAPRDFINVNALGSANLLQAARSAKIKSFVHISTSEVYGSAQYVPIDERHPQVAQSPYAASKIAADKTAEAFHRSFRLPVITVRPFNCFGPRQSPRAVLPTIIIQALRGKTIRLGNIHTRRDLNFVDDIAEGMIAAGFCRKAIGKTFNLATGVDHSIKELVELVGEILGKKLTIKLENRRRRPAASEVTRLQGSRLEAEKLFGYAPRTVFKDALRKTIAFYEKNLTRYRKEDYQL